MHVLNDIDNDHELPSTMNPILLDLPDSCETDRLWLRCARAGDGAALNAAIIESITQLRQWMPWAREMPTSEQSEAYSRHAQANFLLRSDLTLRMLRKSDGLMVGSTGLHPRDWDVPSFEIGYWVRTSLAGQGYATEAVRGVTAFAIRHLQSRRIQIRCDAENLRSQRVALAAGYVLESISVNDCRTCDGQLRTSHTYVHLA